MGADGDLDTPSPYAGTMARSPWFLAGLFVLIAVLILSAVSAVATPGGALGRTSAGNVVASAVPTGGTAAHAAKGSSGGATTFGVDSARAATVAADERSHLSGSGNPGAFLPPNLNQAPALASTGDHVVPLYSIAPAPMGVAYYGLSNTTGVTQTATLNTTSLEGTFSTSDPLGVQTEEFDFGSQNTYGAQLNAVFTNVTLFGQTSFGPNTNAPTGCPTGTNLSCPNEFWLQNVINYNTASHALSFENNIWNFSNPTAAWTSGTNAVQGFSTPRGGYYATGGPTITISYPFTLALYLNTTTGPCHLDTVAGSGASSCGTVSTTAPVNEVFFNYSVWNSAGQHVCPTTESTGKVCGEYDDVFFNSVSPTVNPSGVPAYGPNGRVGSATIQANGSAYDPVGLTNDFEFDYGIGSSSGATTGVVYANAEVGINYCPAADTSPTGACNQYAATPAAYDYGGETGETDSGANGYWAPQGTAGPGPTLLTGSGTPVAHYVTGPSLLDGLWNGSGAAYPTGSGAYPLDYANIVPANAWIGIAAGSGVTNQSEFQVAPTFGWFSARTGSGGAPTATTLGADLYLEPGVYTVEVLLSGYDPVMQNVSLVSSGATPSITLTWDPSTGVYTPLWAFSASDLANISTSGLGTTIRPYLLESAAPTVGAPYGVAGSLSWLFSNLNDYMFTEWIGVYINGTSTPAGFNPPPSLTMEYPSWQDSTIDLFDVPTTDQFQFYYFDVQNFAMVGGSHIYSYANSEATTLYSVVVNNGMNDLIADNTFAVSNRGLELLNGGSTFPATPVLKNTRNVVWGNTFVADPQPSYAGLSSPSTTLGFSGESYDRIYNNAFDTYSSAFNFSISASSSVSEWWNATCVSGYSPLSSSQYPGPTYCEPLSYSQTIDGQKLKGSIDGSNYQGGNAWSTFGNVANPYGNLPFKARTSSVTGSAGIGSTTQGYAGDYAPLVTTTVYRATYTETGLPSSTTTTAFTVRIAAASGTPYLWLNETATSASPASCAPSSVCLNFYVPNGSYRFLAAPVTISSVGYVPDPALGSLTVAGAAPGTTTIAYGAGEAITFTESGLPVGDTWYVNITGQAPLQDTTTGGGGSVGITLGPGSYAYTVAVSDHRYYATYTSPLVVTSAAQNVPVSFLPYTYAATFTESGLPSGLGWTVSVDGTPMSLTTDGGTDSLTFELTNGSHTYAIDDISGWHQGSIPYSGSFSVNGAPVTESMSYSEVTYGVAFTESTLPSGQSWSITFNGVTSTMTTDGGTDTLTFASEPNGTYSYSIADISGWHQGSIPYTGTETVSGAALSIPLVYSQVDYGVSFTESTLPSGQSWSVTFDGVTQSTVTDGGTDSLDFGPLPNGTYSYSIADISGWHQTSLPYSGTETVSGGALAFTLVYSPVTYSIDVSESGLPASETFSATVGTTTASLTTDGGTDTLTFAVTNGSYDYAIADVSGWHITSGSYSGSVDISGAGTTVAVTFSEVTYGVTFSESGIASGQSWSVTFNGVTMSLTTDGGTDTLTFASEPNGTFGYAIADTSGWHQTSLAYTGSLTVDGAALAETLGYVQVTYPVTVSETGLPGGLSWTVTVNGVTQSLTTDGGTDTLTFAAEPNGSYAYAITDISGWHQGTLAYSGDLAVTGTGYAVTLVYSQVTYSVTFKETGLPSGTSWSVSIGAETLSSTTAAIVFSEPNGTHSYAIGNVPGYHLYTGPYTGSVHVNGAGVTVSKRFVKVTYTITFTESGLPSSTAWSVRIGGTKITTTTTSISFTEPNGSYAYVVANVPGWHISSGAYKGTAVVNGASIAFTETFQQELYKVVFTETGLKHGATWSVTIGATTVSTSAARLSFMLSNDTYSYTVTASGYTATPSSGSFTLSGRGVTEAITFS